MIDHISRRHAVHGAKWLSFFGIRQGSEELLVRDSLESLFYMYVLVQDTLFASYRKTENCPDMTEKTLTVT